MEPKGKKKKWEILFIYIILLTRAFPPKNKLSLMFFKILSKFIQVRSFYEHSCAILSSLKIMIIFNKVSWCIIENDHSFERTEDRVTVFLKWTDFRVIERILSQTLIQAPRIGLHYCLIRFVKQIILRSNVHRHHFYLPNVVIQVKSDNGVFNRLVLCIRCN